MLCNLLNNPGGPCFQGFNLLTYFLFLRFRKILRMCVEELVRRLPVDFKGVNVKVITKTGVQDLDY